jgi:hypothetical protein
MVPTQAIGDLVLSKPPTNDTHNKRPGSRETIRIPGGFEFQQPTAPSAQSLPQELLRRRPSKNRKNLWQIGTISCKLDTGNLSLHSIPF